MTFSGKTILIVGGNSGIGLALQQQLTSQGAAVIVASRSKPASSEVIHISVDVTQDVSVLTDSLPEVVHGVAYCPGTINLKPFARLTEADFLYDWQVNAMGAVRVVQTLIPNLKKAQGASVLFYSSVAANMGMNFHSSVAMAKGALQGLTLSLAAEFASSKIRFNAIAPSLTDTPLAGGLLSSSEKREASAKRHPLGRVGTVQELGKISTFLLSSDADWITGQIISVDGGISVIKNM